MTTRSDEIRGVLSSVLGRRERREVRRIVIQRVPVAVMDHGATGHGPVGRFPVDHGTEAPTVRLCDLDPGSRCAILVVPDARRTDREFVRGRVARLELARGREPQALPVRLAPRCDAGLKPGRGPRGVGARFSVLGGARLRAALRSTFMGGLVSERLAAPLAGLLHTSILATSGLGTVPLRARKLGRRGRASELNPTSFRDAVMYQRELDLEQATPTLFDLLEIEAEAAA